MEQFLTQSFLSALHEKQDEEALSIIITYTVEVDNVVEEVKRCLTIRSPDEMNVDHNVYTAVFTNNFINDLQKSINDDRRRGDELVIFFKYGDNTDFIKLEI